MKVQHTKMQTTTHGSGATTSSSAATIAGAAVASGTQAGDGAQQVQAGRGRGARGSSGAAFARIAARFAADGKSLPPGLAKKFAHACAMPQSMQPQVQPTQQPREKSRDASDAPSEQKPA